MKVSKLVDDRILVRLDPPDEASGLLYVPEVAREKPRSGIVLKVGPGKLMTTGRRVPVDVPVGSRIWFGKHAIDHELGDGTAFTTERDVALVTPA